MVLILYKSMLTWYVIHPILYELVHVLSPMHLIWDPAEELCPPATRGHYRAISEIYTTASPETSCLRDVD